MVFQGLDQRQAEAIWQPFLDWVAALAAGLHHRASPPMIVARAGAAFLGSPTLLKQRCRASCSPTTGPARPRAMCSGRATRARLGKCLHGYQSAWLPASLLQKDRQDRLADALFAASRHWRRGAAFQQGPGRRTRRGHGGRPGHGDESGGARCLRAGHRRAAKGRRPIPALPATSPTPLPRAGDAGAIDEAMDELRKIVPSAGSYVSESNYFDAGLAAILLGCELSAGCSAVKEKYDPAGLFFVHHGVGSERWSADGFTRLK